MWTRRLIVLTSVLSGAGVVTDAAANPTEPSTQKIETKTTEPAPDNTANATDDIDEGDGSLSDLRARAKKAWKAEDFEKASDLMLQAASESDYWPDYFKAGQALTAAYQFRDARSAFRKALDLCRDKTNTNQISMMIEVCNASIEQEQLAEEREQQLESMSQVINSLRQDLESAERDAEVAKAGGEEAQKRLKGKQDEIDRLKSQLSKAEDKRHEVEDLLAEARAQLEERDRIIARMRKENANLKAQVALLQNQKRKLEEENEKLKREIKRLRTRKGLSETDPLMVVQ